MSLGNCKGVNLYIVNSVGPNTDTLGTTATEPRNDETIRERTFLLEMAELPCVFVREEG